MKKIRRILSFVIAMAMIMSMSTLCFLVTAEGEGTNPVAGTTYTLDIDIGNNVYENGQFKLCHNSATAPVVVEDGQTIYTEPASGNYSVDIVGSAFVTFTAPVDGTYSFNVDLEKLAVNDGGAVSHFASIVFHISGDAAKANTGWGPINGAGTTANHSQTWSMKAGDMIVLQVNPEDDNTTQGTDRAIALKDFSVTLDEVVLPPAAGTTYTLDIDTATEGYAKGPFMLGTGDVYNANANGAGIYTDAASDEYSVDIVGDAKVYFIAPVSGLYSFNVDLEKLAVNDGGAVSHFASNVFYISGDAAKDNTGWGPINGAGTTANHSKIWTMQEGDMIVLQVGPESDNTTQGTDRAIALKDFSVTLEEILPPAVGTKYTLGVNVANGDTKGFFTLGLNNALTPSPAGGEVTNYYRNPANGEYPIDVIQYTSFIYFTAPADGKYTMNVDLEKGPISNTEATVNTYAIVFHAGSDGDNKGNSGDYVRLYAAGETLNITKTWDLVAGDKLVLQIGQDGNLTGEDMAVAVKDFSVTYGETEHVCTEWNNDGTCKTGATCVSCGEKTGATNANNHELDTFTYTDNEDGATHTKKNACCGATVDATEAHVFEDGECDCGATYIAPAYSAGLATDTASVRKNQTAYVTVDIAGTNAKYAAGEIVVTFDDDIFNFNEAASTLPANTKVEATTGKIVLVITGADKEFGAEGAIVKLAFDAVAETTGSDITLSSAAFSLRADAKSEDLTAATIQTATVSIEVTAQLFNVSVGEHLTADAEQVTEGDAFEFTYSAADGAYYDYDITVMSGDTDITEFVTFADGKWTVPAQYITDDLTITTTEPTAKEFGVTITPDGYATGNANAYYKTDYTFVIIPDEGDESSTVAYNTYVLGTITINGVTYGGEGNPAIADVATTTDGKTYVIKGTEITGAIAITIATVVQDPGSVNVTVNAPADVTVDAEDKATLGQAFEFTVDFSQADTLYTYTVLYNGTPIEAVEGVYITPNVTAPVVITVEKTLKTAVSVKSEKEYLDLGEAGKMWLVLNDMDKLDGKVYTINGEAMFWSDRYGAYCYIVIADEAPAANSFTIDIIDGTVTEIDYGMNVNKSLNVDANDAQLVYDMYNKEYTSFDVVTMEKFLRADVGETVDFLVDTGDATAIITACVNKYISNN